MHAVYFTRSVDRDVRMGGSGGTSSRAACVRLLPGRGLGWSETGNKGAWCEGCDDFAQLTFQVIAFRCLLKNSIFLTAHLLFSSSWLPLQAKTVTLRGMRLHRAFEQPLCGVLAKNNVSSHWCDSECLIWWIELHWVSPRPRAQEKKQNKKKTAHKFLLLFLILDQDRPTAVRPVMIPTDLQSLE